MAFNDQARFYYFHDLWKRTPTTWGGGAGYTWTRVDVPSGPKLDYPDFARSETRSNLIRLGAYGQRGIGRRWRWNGSTWVLEETRTTETDTGALDPMNAGLHPVSNATLAQAAAAERAKEDGRELVMLGAVGVAALILWDIVR
jgi:hypothetical protein